MFSFVTTKYWGKGPKNWTLPLINFKTLAGVIDGSTGQQLSGSQELNFFQSNLVATGGIDPPAQLCNWSIHIDDVSFDYEPIDPQPSSPARNDGDQFDVEDESTWREWNDQPGRDLTSTITQGLRANAFTTHQAEDVPIAIDQIVNIVCGSMKDAKVEAIGFAIMARNVDALCKLVTERDFNLQALRDINPYHLAAKFLDGSKTCCGVMSELLTFSHDETSIGVNYTDNLGLTVLDTLFITILRSHSSASPLVLGQFLSVSDSNFEGVDVDICGRWDADSPCVRQLHAAGETTIPKEWKHMFCHTSAQAVCHCLTTIFMDLWAPNINTASGLFHRRCQSCGLELKVGPLHSFVLICVHLASAGRPGETLFGMLACLVCLLTIRADPSSSAEISLPAILGTGETEDCQHQPLNAAELAFAVPKSIVDAWTPEVKLGWEAIKELLDHCVRPRQTRTFNVTDESCPSYIHVVEREDKRQYVECGDERLGTIWAAIQVELLTYRRLEVGDSWLSPMFDMHDVVEGLRAREASILMRSLEHRGKDTLQPFSTCGLFLEADHPGCARREEACATYFANLDDWKRTTFIRGRGL